MFIQLAPATDKNEYQKVNKGKIHAKTNTPRINDVSNVQVGGLKRFRAYTSHHFHGKTKNNVVIFVKASMVHSGDFKRILLAWHNNSK